MKLNQHGIINMITSVCLLIIIIMALLIAFNMENPMAGIMIGMFGSLIPAILIGAVWTENFGQHLLKYKEQFQKQYMENK